MVGGEGQPSCGDCVKSGAMIYWGDNMHKHKCVCVWECGHHPCVKTTRFFTVSFTQLDGYFNSVSGLSGWGGALPTRLSPFFALSLLSLA